MKSALFFALIFSVAVFCEPHKNNLPLPAVDEDKLASEVSERLSRFTAFQRLKAEAESRGLRVFLFGGTATAVANYVRWDMIHESGKHPFPVGKFDYDLTNVFHVNQDIDLVVDGPPEAAEAFEKEAQKIVPLKRGDKSAVEVRLLRQDRGDKARLLRNPDLLKQNNDTLSLGLIEITDPPPGTSRLKDVRDPFQKTPDFIRDLANGQITFLPNPEHKTTDRFQSGKNPAIFSVLRVLAKASQYDLKISDTNWVQMKKIVAEFNPVTDLNHPYTKAWFELNGKKIIQGAIDLERTIRLLDDVGLTRILARFPNVREVGTFAWLANRVPLQTDELGAGQGKTAKQLGLSVVAHEAADLSATLSIMNSINGRPNVFISRNGSHGEKAIHGDGFYTQVGDSGDAVQRTDLHIRFILDPRAREGTDFKVVRRDTGSTKWNGKPLNGDYVIVLNRAALTLVTENHDLPPSDYFLTFATYDGGTKRHEAGKAVEERSRLRMQTKIASLSDEELARIAEQVYKNAKDYFMETGYEIFTEAMRFPRLKEVLRPKIQNWIRKGDDYLINHLGSEIFSDSAHNDMEIEFRLCGEHSTSTYHGATFFEHAFRNKHWQKEYRVAEQFIDLANRSDIDAGNYQTRYKFHDLFGQPGLESWEPLLIKSLHMKPLYDREGYSAILSNLASSWLMQLPHIADLPRFLALYFKLANPETRNYVVEQWRDRAPEILESVRSIIEPFVDLDRLGCNRPLAKVAKPRR